MAFPLIIDGYFGYFCYKCNVQRNVNPSNGTATCFLFGEIEWSRSAKDWRRCERCIQMEQQYKGEER